MGLHKLYNCCVPCLLDHFTSVWKSSSHSEFSGYHCTLYSCKVVNVYISPFGWFWLKIISLKSSISSDVFNPSKIYKVTHKGWDCTDDPNTITLVKLGLLPWIKSFNGLLSDLVKKKNKLTVAGNHIYQVYSCRKPYISS